ncbi:MAG: tRNA modification GTPase, partial [Luteibaculaceae bacterium]
MDFTGITEDTICAIATAPGMGAIAVIRVSGKNTFPILEKVFSKSLENLPSHSCHLGKIVENKRVIDEVLLTLFRNPKSFTGEDVIEIACHGSTYIQKEILRVLFKAGCRMARPGEFTLRGFYNGKMDLSQAEAVGDLIHSTSETSHALAMDQMRGGFSRKIEELRKQLIHFASLIELELDFAEEDVEFANRDELRTLIN